MRTLDQAGLEGTGLRWPGRNLYRGRSLMNRLTLALGVALATLVAAAPVAARSTAATATTVTVKMKEFKFTLSKKTVPHGTVTFTLKNVGTLPHDFKIGIKKSKMIKPG